MSENHSIVSIIVPVYKVEKYIHTCVDSVLRQSYPYWELILVDDGSPDGCPAICDKYAENDERIIVLHKENGGQSSARNLALDYQLKGDFITFLDSDDFWHEKYLERLVYLQEKYNADIVQCGFIKGDANDFPEINEKNNISVCDNHQIFLTGKAKIIMWALLYRKDLFDGVRMPEGIYNEDDWTTWKLYYRAKTIAVTSEKLYYYRYNPNSTMTLVLKKPDLRYLGAYEERIGFFQKSGEKDLEDISRLQLCKSLVLTYKNKLLTKEERIIIKQKFNDNWIVIYNSTYVKNTYKFLFSLFYICPLFTSNIINKFRN